MNKWHKTAIGTAALLGTAMLGACDALWDAEMDVSPDYYGIGLTVPSYGYYPGPPPIDPNIWGPSWGNWGGWKNRPLPPLGVRPGGNSYQPNLPNDPVGNIRPGYTPPTVSTPSVPQSTQPAQPPTAPEGYSRGRH